MTPLDFLDRIVVDGHDHEEWAAARVGKWGGSDAMSAAKIESAHLYLRAKLQEGWTGNAYTAHGNDRERAILRQFGVEQNKALFHATDNPLHVCTPDGIATKADEFALVQVKTSGKPLPATTPKGYLRQIWWEQYVMGAEVSLLIWEQHDGSFAPLNMEPETRIIYRDDAEIATLVTIADLVLDGMRAAEEFRRELASS